MVSLNPIMIDGTGMCGGCRCTVDGERKFACVDGPHFDGHQVDFDELMRRNSTFSREERLSLLSSVTKALAEVADQIEHDGAVVTGAGLAAYCPSCRAALTVLDPSAGEVSVHLTCAAAARTATLYLAPSAEGGRRTTTLELCEGKAVQDVLCPALWHLAGRRPAALSRL